ncbi:unnamed protein product [Phaedon cochleariae]|uniref:Fatty acid desaturase domain-containing protein n=1 Tax=Phaedon cochleariae TaxID=80249 RepID=A0A9P0DSL5_PHACE|nr:unnamed protein product [Phaedon cochleariae]
MTTTVLTDQVISKKPRKIHRALMKEEKPIPSYPPYKFYKWEFKTPVQWFNVFVLSAWHLLAVLAAFYIDSWTKPKVLLFYVILATLTGLGITGAAHRYFTHRSYKARLPLKIFLLFCFSIAGQNSLVEWVRDHRTHHKFSETDADPHNAKRGFFFSHVGWLMMKKHPDVIRKGRTVDISDLLDDPIIVFYQKYFNWFKIPLCFVIPTLVAHFYFDESWFNAIAGVCFVKYIISLNSTWCVNSAAHLFGNKPYDKKIYPSENLLVSLIAMGEGYHNYHHTFPWDYRTAEFGKMLNATALWIDFFEKIGLAYDLKSPSEELVRKVVENQGDGSHYKWGHEVPYDANENKKFVN